MTVYTWGGDSPIEKVETPHGKAKDAVIYAASGSEKGELAAIPDMLRSLGMTVVPDKIDDKFVLRVSGFQNEKEVASALEENSFVQKAARQEQATPKVKEKLNPLAVIREKSAVASGWTYFVGDAILAAAGVMRKDYNEVAQAAAFTSASLVMMKYGAQDGDKAFSGLYDKMLLQFNKEGIEVPELKHTSVKELTKPGGFVQKVDEFLSHHPTEVFTAINAYAGYQGILAGKEQKNPMKLAAGALILTGMATAALVPEKGKNKIVPEAVEQIGQRIGEHSPVKDVWKQPVVEEAKGVVGTLFSPVKKFTDWVQEKPLRFGGYLAIANNVASMKGSLDERKTNPALAAYLPHIEAGTTDSPEAAEHRALLQKKMTKKDFGDLHKHDLNTAEGRESFGEVRDRVGQAGKFGGAWKVNLAASATYMLANALLSISSKDGGGGHGHGGGGGNKKDVNAELVAASAAVIAAQPEEARNELIDKMSAFMAEQRGIKFEPKELAEQLRAKVAEAEQSPWLTKVGGAKEAAPVSHVQAVTQQREQAQHQSLSV
ncbi:MAG: hypothetical protein FJX23_02260 [Alphaproteobacteria bacterium]|nr:hypothetical protein [Alphaproteobacteria bacterium]